MSEVSSVIEFICSVEAERLCAEKFTLSAVLLIMPMMFPMVVKMLFSVLARIPSSSSESISILPLRSPALSANAVLTCRSCLIGFLRKVETMR